MGKNYDENVIKEEKRLTKVFLELRNDYEVEYDEKKQEKLRIKMKKTFHKLCPLRKKLDIYTSGVNEEKIVNDIITMIDKERRERPIDETFPIEN